MSTPDTPRQTRRARRRAEEQSPWSDAGIDPETPAQRARARRWWTLARRRWAYSVMVAAGGVAIAYGLIDPPKLAAVLGLGVALLGGGTLALKNPTED